MHGGWDAGKHEDTWVGKGLTHGKGWPHLQSKGHVQQCTKLIELERMDRV